MTGLGARVSRAWWPSATVFAFVLAAQLWLVGVAGTDIPFQDQWDAEGRADYPALLDGSMTVADYFRPHNEHRIVWTRLLNAVLFKLNGQWDPLLQLIASAWLHATGAALLVVLLTRGLSSGTRWLIMLAVVILSLPLAGWHNALWGFQSQVYFVMLLSVLAFYLHDLPTPSPWRILTGWLVVIAAMLAMGPGLLIPAVLAGGLGLRWIDRRVRWAEIWPLFLLLALAGWLLQPVPEHVGLQAKSVGRFFAVLGRLLAWPLVDQPWAALILNLPLIVAVGGRLGKRRSPAIGEHGVVLLAGWAVAIALGAAWTRGGGSEFASGVPSRYADLVALLPLANVWFAIQLARETSPRRQISVRLVTAAWGVALLGGWMGLSAGVMRGVILPRAHDRDAPVRLMRAFQQTNNAEVFVGQPRLLVPHPNLDSVRAVLQDPRMTGVLPPSMQPDRPMGPLSRGVRRLLGR